MTKFNKELRRLKRLLFPSPAEKQFVKVMGWSFFLLNDVKREYKLRGYMIDFAIPTKRIALEVDGKNYHGGGKDIVRDMALNEAGWYVYRIKASELWSDPRTVRKYVKLFVSNPDRYIAKYG